MVRDKDGSLLAFGMYDPTGPLASWKPQPTEFLAAPMPGEPAVNVDDQLADAVMKAIRSPQVRIWQPVTVEPTLPPLPSFTPVFRPHACPDVPRPGAWTPPDEGMREHVAAVLARPARSALGSWVDDVLAAPPGLGHLQPGWEDGGWASA